MVKIGKGKSAKQVNPLALCLGVLILGGIIFGIYSYVRSESAGVAATTFVGYSYTDGEDISNFVEISVWAWDDAKTYNEPEDLRRLSNFEKIETAKDIDLVSVDVTAYPYGVWVEIDPDGESYFSNNFIWIPNTQNVENYPLYCYHQPADVNFAVLDVQDLDEFLPLGANETTDGNYSVYVDFPRYNTTDIHANADDWTVDDDAWEDMSDSEKLRFYDQRNWRVWAPTYDPDVDTDKDFSTVFERYTTVPAFKFTFNTSVSTVDGNAAQVNFTISGDDYPELKIQVSGSYIFVLISEEITAPYNFEFEIEFADDIECDSVHSGYVTCAGDETSATWASTLSAIAA